MNKDVKKNLLNHSQIKVRLLGEYLKRYLNIIANDGYTERIIILDLFSGEGIYENGGEGSPMVILRKVKDLYYENVAKLKKIPKIDCHFNDANSDKIKKLKKSLEKKSLHQSQFGDLSFSTDDYQEIIPKILTRISKLKNQKLFIFIDPYNYKHIKSKQIKKLLETGKTEILLWLPTQFMYRFHKNGTPKALKDFIEEITPYKNWDSNESVWKFVTQLRDSFQNLIGDKKYVDSFTIQKDLATVFCLFFFSSHIKGFEKMLEAKWDIDTEQGKGWIYTGNQPSLFETIKTNPLEEKLRTFMSDNKKTNGEIYEFVLQSSFLPKHANEVFLNWQKSGSLEVKLKNGTLARKSSFYINYKYYKAEGDKVTYEIPN